MYVVSSPKYFNIIYTFLFSFFILRQFPFPSVSSVIITPLISFYLGNREFYTMTHRNEASRDLISQLLRYFFSVCLNFSTRQQGSVPSKNAGRNGAVKEEEIRKKESKNGISKYLGLS